MSWYILTKILCICFLSKRSFPPNFSTFGVSPPGMRQKMSYLNDSRKILVMVGTISCEWPALASGRFVGSDDGPRSRSGKMNSPNLTWSGILFVQRSWWKTTKLDDMFVICVFFVGGSKVIYVHYVWFIGVFCCILDFLMLNILHVKWFELMPMSS